jgi:hypothetical protein
MEVELKAAASSRQRLRSRATRGQLCRWLVEGVGEWCRAVVADCKAHASRRWGFNSEEGLGPNTYTHALFADFDLAGRK